MTLRSELQCVMQAVADANPRSPLEVAQAGVQCFDFIAARGKSIIANFDAFDRLHRLHYQPEREADSPQEASDA